MQVSFRTIQTSTGRKPVGGALRARAAVRPALRQGCAFLLGLAGGWAVLYGALMPFGLGLTLGFGEDCFAVGAAGAALGLQYSRNGKRAALAAGASVIWIPDLVTELPQEEPYLTARFEHLGQVARWMARIRTA